MSVLIMLVLVTTGPVDFADGPAMLDQGSLALSEGAGFWSGLACGISVMGAIAATVSPEPLSKFTLGVIYTETIVSCGFAFS